MTNLCRRSRRPSSSIVAAMSTSEITRHTLISAGRSTSGLTVDVERRRTSTQNKQPIGRRDDRSARGRAVPRASGPRRTSSTRADDDDEAPRANDDHHDHNSGRVDDDAVGGGGGRRRRRSKATTSRGDVRGSMKGAAFGRQKVALVGRRSRHTTSRDDDDTITHRLIARSFQTNRHHQSRVSLESWRDATC